MTQNQFDRARDFNVALCNWMAEIEDNINKPIDLGNSPVGFKVKDRAGFVQSMELAAKQWNKQVVR